MEGLTMNNLEMKLNMVKAGISVLQTKTDKGTFINTSLKAAKIAINDALIDTGVSKSFIEIARKIFDTIMAHPATTSEEYSNIFTLDSGLRSALKELSDGAE